MAITLKIFCIQLSPSPIHFSKENLSFESRNTERTFFKEKIQIIQVVPGMDPLNAQLRYMELVDQYVKYLWKNQEYFGSLVHFLDFQSSVKCRPGHHSLFPGL